MKPFSVLISSLSAAAALILAVACTEKSDYRRIEGFAQGGTYTVTFRVPEGAGTERLQQEIDSILAGIDNSLSGYNKGSLLSRLNAGEDLPLDSIFIRCFERSTEVWRESEGAFDPSAAPLFDIWCFGFEDGGSPTQEQIARALGVVGMDKFTLECRADGTHLVKADSLAKLNFNAIAQGFTCDLIARYLHSIGVKDMLVDIGEIYCEGVNPKGRGWSIGIDTPFDGNNTPGASLSGIWESDGGAHGVVTSGNYRKFHIKDGKKYAHTIDPRTGRPVDHDLLSATVVAPTATEADALATYFMVAGFDEARKYIEAHPGIEACLICSDSTWCSRNF